MAENTKIPGTTSSITSRRAVLGTGVGVGAAALLAACGGGDSGGDAPATQAPTSESGGGSSAGGGDAVAKTSDVPVGSGTILKDEQVVLTQPTEGDFKAFTAVCTHQGCIVSSIEGDEIVCACHNSVFSTADGSVVSGPATAPLAAESVTVQGDDLVLG